MLNGAERIKFKRFQYYKTRKQIQQSTITMAVFLEIIRKFQTRPKGQIWNFAQGDSGC